MKHPSHTFFRIGTGRNFVRLCFSSSSLSSSYLLSSSSSSVRSTGLVGSAQFSGARTLHSWPSTTHQQSQADSIATPTTKTATSNKCSSPVHRRTSGNSASTTTFLPVLPSSSSSSSPCSSSSLRRRIHLLSLSLLLQKNKPCYLDHVRSFSFTHPTRNMHSKVVVIGSGPAGHTAAIYTARADLNPVLYEGYLALGIAAGGQLTMTDEVENYPGFEKIGGPELMDKIRAQSECVGTKIVSQTVAKVDLQQRPFKYWLHPMGQDDVIEEETHTADSIIIATGAIARRLYLPNEDKLWGFGVSACAVCDGSLPMFRNRPLAVIGGGDSAVEESVYLTKKASKVYVLVRRDKLRASAANAKRLMSNEKIEVLFNTEGTEIVGEDKPDGVLIGLKTKNNKNGETRQLDVNGLFYAIGHDPATTLFKGQLDMDEDDYIITKPGTTFTSVPGVFAAGDVQDKRYRQAITSAGTGCMAALDVEKWLDEQES